MVFCCSFPLRSFSLYYNVVLKCDILYVRDFVSTLETWSLKKKRPLPVSLGRCCLNLLVLLNLIIRHAERPNKKTSTNAISIFNFWFLLHCHTHTKHDSEQTFLFISYHSKCADRSNQVLGWGSGRGDTEKETHRKREKFMHSLPGSPDYRISAYSQENKGTKYISTEPL